MKKAFIGLLILMSGTALAQTGNVGINTTTPEPTAALDIFATDKGVLPPRLTTAQRDAIATPATGLVIYNSIENQLEIFNGTCWIPSFLEDCEDCLLDISFTHTDSIIDRIDSLGITIPFHVEQELPVDDVPIKLLITHDFGEETSVSLSDNAFSGSDDGSIRINTSVFEEPGDYEIGLFGFCGSRVYGNVVTVSIAQCTEIEITDNAENYVLEDIIGTTPQCVVVTINERVEITSADASDPAFTTGNIAGSRLGVLNQGNILGRGGDGSESATDAGQVGGNALDLQCPAEIRNNGIIYAGGGGGRATGFSYTVDLPWPIPDLTFGIGSGGGGGVPYGEGAGGGLALLPFWSDGDDAGERYDDEPGEGGNYSQSIGISVVSIDPEIIGGDGGDFGEEGDSGSVGITIGVDIPIVGSFEVYSDEFELGLGGADGGTAIKTNGNTINIQDGDYQTYRLRGTVQN